MSYKGYIGQREFAQAAKIYMDSGTDRHRFCGPDSGLASLYFKSLSGDRILGTEKRGLE